MNDDLYGHELYDGEEVIFVQLPQSFGPAINAAAIFAAAVVAVTLWLGDTHATAWRASNFVVLALMASCAAKLGSALALSASNGIALQRKRPAMITNHRVIAKDGNSIPLKKIAATRCRLSSVEITGQKLADGLTLRALPHAKSFHAALERQLT
ncbi:MAG: hypothetical protein ACU0BK_10910 [Shimia sp.]|uniref:hypothetical protein n=1 Tax=Shimia sp. TaxID=1954381 RepID=UPI004059EE66